MFVKQRRAVLQRDTAPRVPWSIVGGRSMQRSEKTGEVGCGCVFSERGRDERRFTVQPSRHAPRPRKSAHCSADADGARNGHRQVTCEGRQPVLFVLDELRRYRATGQTNCQIVAETERAVVQPFPGIDEKEPG